MLDILKREIIYLWYYITVITEQILPYWFLGVIIGSLVSVFAKDKINFLFLKLSSNTNTLLFIMLSSILGILSPLCMYGTIPITASFSNKGVRDEYISVFMISSILLNPQLIIYSAILGKKILYIRIVSAFLCGVIGALLIKIFYKEKSFFNFNKLREPINRDIHPNMLIRLLQNIYRNIKGTYIYFLIGIILSALFQRYINPETFNTIFIKNNILGILFASIIGVPLYVCGGGTIPLLRSWLNSGMSIGAASAFMLTGQATKITNLSAIKIVLGIKNFTIYMIFIFIFSFITGVFVNIFIE